jgi:hypothetical protein
MKPLHTSARVTKLMTIRARIEFRVLPKTSVGLRSSEYRVRVRSPFLFVAFRSCDVAHWQQVETNDALDRGNSCKKRGTPKSKHSISDMRVEGQE